MKYICEECDWHGPGDQVLTAKNPFADNDTVVGCPHCKQPNCLTQACDEPGCWRPVTCGTPTPTGYRQTCNDHAPPSA